MLGKQIAALSLSCLLLFAAGTCLAQTPGHTLRSGGIDRTYRLHLPEGLPDGAPLVIVLHGYGGQGDPERFDMNRVADRHGFAVCYPQGERDGRGKTLSLIHISEPTRRS